MQFKPTKREMLIIVSIALIITISGAISKHARKAKRLEQKKVEEVRIAEMHASIKNDFIDFKIKQELVSTSKIDIPKIYNLYLTNNQKLIKALEPLQNELTKRHNYSLTQEDLIAIFPSFYTHQMKPYGVVRYQIDCLASTIIHT